MILYIAALAGISVACAACSAPTVDTTLTASNPASPVAQAAPFVRPVNVLATSPTPATGIPPTAMTAMSHSSMAGMDHGAMAGMSDSASPVGVQMAQAAGGRADATGTVNAVDAAKHTINVSHDPIKAIGWPSMTMDFPVAPSVDLNAVKPGAKISFTLGRNGPDGSYRVESLKPAAAGTSKKP